jgi:serine/threonine protein kinase
VRECARAVCGAHFLLLRDIACRNLLLTDTLVVKVSDFGLSRAKKEKDYYRKEGLSSVPVRWMAPECFESGRFK